MEPSTDELLKALEALAVASYFADEQYIEGLLIARDIVAYHLSDTHLEQLRSDVEMHLRWYRKTFEEVVELREKLKTIDDKEE